MEIKPILNFRNLHFDEIDVRVQSIKENGFVILLYKDARCDMNILDETVGTLFWKREHTRDNANCVVSIYNQFIKEWVSKEDTGTESNSDKEKGLASDSFKRACFNWGIGRELYTAPFIWVSDMSYAKEFNGKKVINEKFKVSSIEYENKNIVKIKITDSKGKEVFSYGYSFKNNTPEVKKDLSEEDKKEKAIKLIEKLCVKNGLSYDEAIFRKMTITELTEQYNLLKG